MKEIFKDVLGYEGLYQISNFGNLKSLKCGKEKFLKLNPNTRGYVNVKLYKNSIKKSFKLHVLVAVAFLGHVPDGTQKIVVDHIDNNKLNNYANNLQLITQRENSSKDKKNKTSKYTGVYFSKKMNSFVSRIRINGISKYLGCFKDEFKAHMAYQNALKELKN